MSGRLWRVKPLGAYRVATELRAHGYSVKVIDFFDFWLDNPADFFKLLNLVVGANTLFVGFSGTFFNFRKIGADINSHDEFYGSWSLWPIEDHKMEVYLKYIKKTFPNIKTVYGGISEPKHIQQASKYVDFVVSGLADTTVIELANHLSRQTKLKYMLGSAVGKIINHDTTAAGFDFANSKVEYRDEDHIDIGEVLPLETSRGCLFKCKFCSYPLLGRKKGDPEYHKHTDTVADELKYNYEKYQIDTYMIVDDTFNETTGKLEDLLRARDKSGVDIKFSAYIRSDLLIRFPEQMKLLNELGLVTAFFGVESLYRPSAIAIGKSSHPDKIKELFYKLKQNWVGDELKILASFIIGLPEDNPETLATWIPWIEDPTCPIDMININTLGFSGNSEIELNPEKYGYTITDNKTMSWKNKYWDSDEAKQYADQLRNRFWKSSRFRIAGWDFIGLKSLKLTDDELFNSTLDKLDYNKLFNKQQDLWSKYQDTVIAYESN